MNFLIGGGIGRFGLHPVFSNPPQLEARTHKGELQAIVFTNL